jgi:hypothetical protein
MKSISSFELLFVLHKFTMYDIFFDLGNMHQAVEEEEDYDDWFGEGFSFDFVREVKEKPKATPDYIELKKKSCGHTCTKCREFYPYAEVNQDDGSFKCWGCRNF